MVVYSNEQSKAVFCKMCILMNMSRYYRQICCAIYNFRWAHCLRFSY